MKKATLNILITAVVVLFCSVKLDAQSVSAIYYPDNGDTVIFHLNGYHGNVQWQKSYDTLSWTDIVGATHDTLITLVDTNCYYRAVVSEGTCTPFYSENKKVNTLVLNPKTYTIDTSKATLISDSTQISNGIYYYVYTDTTAIDTSNILLDKNNYGYLNQNCNNCTLKLSSTHMASDDQNEADRAIPMVNCFPNPFTDKTTLQFMLAVDNHVKIDVYNLTGKLIQVLYEGDVNKNQKYSVEFDGKMLPTGVYIYKMTMNNSVYMGKMILIKE